MEFIELHIKFYNSTEYIYAFIQFVQFIKLGNLKYSKLLKKQENCMYIYILHVHLSDMVLGMV